MDNITLADGQSTPANHTFVPTQQVPVSVWTEKLSIPIGEPTISLSYSAATSKRRTDKSRLQIALPVLKAVTGSVDGYAPSPDISHIGRVNCDFVTADRSTLAHRADLLAFFRNFIASEAFEELVLNGVKP